MCFNYPNGMNYGGPEAASRIRPHTTRADIPDRIAATAATAVRPDRKVPWGLRDRWDPWGREAARAPGESQDRPVQWALRVM